MKTYTNEQIEQYRHECIKALDVCTATNNCGVAQTLAKLCIWLGDYTTSTTARNKHPIAKAYLKALAENCDTSFELGYSRTMDLFDYLEDVKKAQDHTTILKYIKLME
jgi:hypothetical protein